MKFYVEFWREALQFGYHFNSLPPTLPGRVIKGNRLVAANGFIIFLVSLTILSLDLTLVRLMLRLYGSLYPAQYNITIRYCPNSVQYCILCSALNS
jgi:hypothetical protein